MHRAHKTCTNIGTRIACLRPILPTTNGPIWREKVKELEGYRFAATPITSLCIIHQIPSCACTERKQVQICAIFAYSRRRNSGPHRTQLRTNKEGICQTHRQPLTHARYTLLFRNVFPAVPSSYTHLMGCVIEIDVARTHE